MTTSHLSWNKILVWVGGITAIITLFFSLRDFTGFFSSASGRRQEVETLLASAALQGSHGQFRAAWDALSQADTMGQLGEKVTAAREDLAMRWLEDGHGTGPDGSLAALADLVSPVLSKGAATAAGNRKADLIAHLGWAEFYRWREGGSSVRPDNFYREALHYVPGNPYASAMLGHFTLWNHEGNEVASNFFRAALAVDSVRPFVRTLQIAAYQNLQSLVGDAELLKVLAEMHHQREPVPVDSRAPVWQMHWSCFITAENECSAERLRATVSAEEHLATWHWLMTGSGFPEAKGVQFQYVEARLEEAAGQTAAAAAIYRKIGPEAKQYDPRIRARIAEGLKRTATTGRATN